MDMEKLSYNNLELIDGYILLHKPVLSFYDIFNETSMKFSMKLGNRHVGSNEQTSRWHYIISQQNSAVAKSCPINLLDICNDLKIWKNFFKIYIWMAVRSSLTCWPNCIQNINFVCRRCRCINLNSKAWHNQQHCLINWGTESMEWDHESSLILWVVIDSDNVWGSIYVTHAPIEYKRVWIRIKVGKSMIRCLVRRSKGYHDGWPWFVQSMR